MKMTIIIIDVVFLPDGQVNKNIKRNETKKREKRKGKQQRRTTNVDLFMSCIYDVSTSFDYRRN